MKKIIMFFVAAYFVFYALSSIAEDEGSQGIPEGMEKVQVGKSEIILPKGAKVTKKGGLIVLESSEEYVARQIANMNERISRIESEHEDIKKAISEINEQIKVKKNMLISDEKIE